MTMNHHFKKGKEMKELATAAFWKNFCKDVIDDHRTWVGFGLGMAAHALIVWLVVL